jgi:hypothetical protein
VSRILGQYFSAEMAALCLVEWALTAVVLYGLLLSAAGLNVPEAHAGAGNLSALLALTIGAIAVVIGLYRPEICLQRDRLLVNAVVAGLLAFPALLLVSGALKIDLNKQYLLWLGQGLVAWATCLLCTRWLFGYAMHRRMFVRRVVVLGNGPEASRTRAHIQSHRRKFFEIVQLEALSPHTGAESRNAHWLRASREQHIWGVVDATGRPGNMSADDGIASALLDLKLRGVRVFDELAFWEHQLGRINLDLADARWLTFGDGFASSQFGERLKRATDILVSLAMLVMTLPLMLLTAADQDR